MRLFRIIIAALLLLMSPLTGICATETLRIDKDGVICLYKDVNLKHGEYALPQGVTIISKGGVFKHGTIIGNDTKIESDRPVFKDVKVKGTWNVPYISTDLFVDLSYDNALRDLVALSSPKVQNTIEVKKGRYVFSFEKNLEIGIALPSNTDLVVDGELTLKPNDFTNYYIIDIQGENIHVSGSGVIIGDKKNHTGSTGEWGMGVNFRAAVNCSVSDLTIKDCWGDCIYVGNKSRNIEIMNCLLDNGRRQGISITYADGVVVKDCTITNVSGTDPQFAIDIEPNKGGTVQNVTVDNVNVENCVGGFMIYGRASGATVDGIVFKNCSTSGITGRYSIKLIRATNVSLFDSSIMTEGEYGVLVQEIDNYVVRDNKWKARKKPLNTISCTNGTVRNNERQ